MSTASETASCAICGGSLIDRAGACPACQGSPDWQELVRAVDFCLRRFEDWHRQGFIRVDEYQGISRDLADRRAQFVQSARDSKDVPTGAGWTRADRCWSCDTTSWASAGEGCCNGCGAPLQGQAVQALRALNYLGQSIKDFQQAGKLPLAVAHSLFNETRERVAAVRGRLEKERVLWVEAVPPHEAQAGRHAPQAAASPRRNLLELLLDPHTIHWLLASGGALLVIGLVVWLWAQGVFENPGVGAGLLGTANATMLVGGWSLIRLTRFQTAGRALTLLACLIMPLNLWFYDANHLITIKEGGHLWVAALVCVGLYAASARLLRDPLFVYVLVGGIAMTGLLFLADRAVDRFWEIASPATLLVVLALISIHLERAFPEGEGPFSRQRFGLAFFWSGQALLGAGLLLLLGTQIIGGWLYEPIFRFAYEAFGARQPAIITETGGRILALILVLAGTYAYFYSDLVVRKIGVYIYLAVFTVLWAEVLAVDLIAVKVTSELIIIVLALTALLANLAQAWVNRQAEAATWETGALLRTTLSRSGQPLGLFLSTVPVVLGVWLFGLSLVKVHALGWTFVLAMLTTAISCRVGAFLYRRALPGVSATYFFGTAAATLVGAAGLLSVLGLTTWQQQAPLLMIIPILYIAAARLYRGHSPEQPLGWVAHAATIAMLVSSMVATFEGFLLTRGQPLNLALAAFFAEAAIFYGLAATFRRQAIHIYLCTGMACGAVWQLLTWMNFSDIWYTLTFAIVGLLLLVAYRFAVLESFRLGGLAETAFRCANGLLSLGFVAGALLTLSHLAAGQRDMRWSLVAMLTALTIISLLAVLLVLDQAWRRWYVVTSVTESVLVVLVLAVFGTLTIWQKLEITSVVVGLGLLVIGHIGWYREKDRQSDLVTLSLLFGSLLASLPLAIALLWYRTRPHFSTPDELGLLAIGLVLLATGFACHIKSTTITGGSMLALYILTLVLYINMIERVQTAAIWMAIGGGTIFGIGLFLSLYRDRLLALPDRIKRREGVFRVLSWR